MPDPRNLVVLTVIVVAVFALSKATFKVRGASATWAHFLHTGILYVLFGLAIGPTGYDLLRGAGSSAFSHPLQNLMPVVQFALGWIGFLFGSHLQWKYMKQFSAQAYLFVILQSLITIGALAATSYFVLRAAGWLEGREFELLLTSCIIGIVAANTAPAAVFSLSRKARTSPTVSMLQFTSALDDVPGIVLLGVVYAGTRFTGPEGSLAEVATLFGLSTAIGILLGIFLKVLLDSTTDDKVEAMLLLAMLCFASGLSGYLGLSTLYTCMILGVTFIHASEKDEDVYKILAEREHTIYALLLVLSGTMITLGGGILQPLIYLLPAYLFLRLLSKYLACFGLIATAFRSLNISPHIGMGLLSQGGMAIPIAIAYRGDFQNYESADVVFVLVVFAVVINELISSVSTRRLLRGLQLA